MKFALYTVSKRRLSMGTRSNSFLTSDGVRLNWLEAGDGTPLVMLPGWSQSAALFREQFKGLSDHMRCIALDHRGHGESDKPEHGYRINRLARDLQEFITYCNLEGIVMMGHSMGSSVIWSYIESFGTKRLSGLVIDDQPAAMTLPNYESKDSLKESGAIFPWEILNTTCSSLVDKDGTDFTRKMIENMLSTQITKADKEWIINENLKLPRRHAATLLFNHSVQDWRDTISTIRVPVLIISGEESVVPPESQRWIQSQIEGSMLEIFASNQGGHHFAFLENPEKFNFILRQFIDGLKGKSDA